MVYGGRLKWGEQPAEIKKHTSAQFVQLPRSFEMQYCCRFSFLCIVIIIVPVNLEGINVVWLDSEVQILKAHN